jgi:pimeloyl-ACP methyl ester carboxylesterase
LSPELTVLGDGVRLAVEDYGGEGAGIVLVHGLSSNVRIWDLTGPRLAARHRVVAYDQRNHGLSDDADDFSFASLTADLDAVVGELGLDHPLVVGHSWGASVALHFAAEHDCRGVVCVDGGVIDMQGMGMTWDQTAELLRPPELSGSPVQLLARIRREQSALPWEAAERVVLRAFPLGENGTMRRRLPIDKHMRIVRELWSERITDVYDRVTCPVLVVVASGLGTDERERGFVEVKREGIRRLHERHPSVRVEWLASVHDVPLLHPAELAERIEEFAAAC